MIEAEAERRFLEAKKAADERLESVMLENAVETGLLKAGGKNMRVLRALIDKNTLSIKDGVTSGLDEQIAALKANSETGFLFENTPKLIGVSRAEEGSDFSEEGLSYEQLCEYMK